VPAFRASAKNAGSTNPDRDAAIMYSGFIHFAIAWYLSTGKIKEADIAPVITACALHIRNYAPNFQLGISYLEDTRNMVMEAIASVQQDPVAWTPHYYDAVRNLVSIDVGSFCGALSADIIYVLGFRP
jgi:hypothetical protein